MYLFQLTCTLKMNSTQHHPPLPSSILLLLQIILSPPPWSTNYSPPPFLPSLCPLSLFSHPLLLLDRLIISHSLLICAIQMFLYVVIKQCQTQKLFINNIKQKVSSNGCGGLCLFLSFCSHHSCRRTCKLGGRLACWKRIRA